MYLHSNSVRIHNCVQELGIFKWDFFAQLPIFMQVDPFINLGPCYSQASSDLYGLHLKLFI